jgi:phosphinothricin acetyltransferase
MARLVRCTLDDHASRILDILNDTIVNSTALFDYDPRPAESMHAWFERKAAAGFPVIGCETDRGELSGFATYDTFRNWPAYRFTVETSVYVHRDFRRQGIGTRVMQELVQLAWRQRLQVLVAGIESSQTASIRLHESLGFRHAGTIRRAGFKFDRWLDLDFYQLENGDPDGTDREDPQARGG